MQEDYVKKFQTIILKIKKVLSEIHPLGIDTSKIETVIKKIQEDANKESIDLYLKYEKLDTEAFYNEYLFQIYQPKINILNNLYNDLLDDYNTYHIIQSKYTLLNDEISESNQNNILEKVSLIKNLLKQFNSTSIKDTELKNNLIDKIYKLIYLTIKLEITLTNKSSLLDYIKLNDIDTSYLESHILKEINDIDLNKKENKEILKRLKELRTQGLNFSYLDEQLLKILSSSNEESSPENKLNLQLLENYIDKFYEYYEEIEELNNKMNDNSKEKEKLEDSINSLTKKHKKTFNRGLKRSLILTGYLIGLTGSIVGIHKLSKYDATTTKYLATIEKYHATNDYQLPKETEYIDSIQNTVNILKYTPWEETNFYEQNFKGYDKFIREVLVYDVSNIEYEELKDYVSLDLVKLGVEPDKIIEDQPSLTPEDLYETSFIIINRTITNSNEYINEINKSNYFGIMSILILLEFVLHFLLSYVIFNTEFISYSIKSSKKDYQKSYELKNNIKQLTIKLENIINIKHSLEKELEFLYQTSEQEYQLLPKEFQKDIEIKDIIKKVRKLNKGDM